MFTSPYRPQANGLCEHSNQTIESILNTLIRDNRNLWDNFLAFALMTPQLKKVLLKPGDHHIAESNGKDMYWRTGIYLDDPKSLNRYVWDGKKKLVEQLILIREQCHNT